MSLGTQGNRSGLQKVGLSVPHWGLAQTFDMDMKIQINTIIMKTLQSQVSKSNQI